MSPAELRSVFGPPGQIPIIFDPHCPDVYYVAPLPRPREWSGIRDRYPLGYLVGSMSAWGAFFAHNLAAAYRPEGVP